MAILKTSPDTEDSCSLQPLLAPQHQERLVIVRIGSPHADGYISMGQWKYYSSLVLNVQYNFASYFYGRCNVPILLHVKIGTKLNVE